MIIRPDKWPNKRQESLRGAAMVDVLPQGIRLRAWPRKRGPGATPEQLADQLKFAQAQRAFNYLAPDFMLTLMAQTEGTPLLPRDLLTAMMFNRFASFLLADGRKLYPMTSLIDVSESLDAISQVEGDLLVRGPERWEGLPFPSLGAFTMLSDQVVPAGTTSINVAGLAAHQIVILMLDNFKSNLSERPQFRVSVDGGSSYFSTNGNYRRFEAGAVTGLTTAAVMTNTASTLDRSAAAVIFNTPAGVINCWANIVRPDFGYLNASTDTITNVRFLATTGTWECDRLMVLGW